MSPSRKMTLLISHLPRRVPSPPRVCRDLLSLHEKRVGPEHRSVTHRHAVVNECTNPDRAAGTKRRMVGFERAVLQRVTLDRGPLIQDAVVADRGESPVRDVDSVVKDPLPDPDAHRPPDHVLEWRAVERVEILH